MTGFWILCLLEYNIKKLILNKWEESKWIKYVSNKNVKTYIFKKKIINLLKKDGHSEINISAIKGPCLAAGLANKMRTGTIIANPNIKEAQSLKKI